MQTSIEQLRTQFGTAHDWFRDTIEDLNEEQARWLPPGLANPIGGTIGHVLTGEDAQFQIVVRGAAPRFASDFADRTGMSPLHPAPGEGDISEWMRTVEIDLAALREYASAVRSTAEDYLAQLDDAEFDRKVEFPGLSHHTVGDYLATSVLPHLFVHTGEIACLKGLQGHRGYNV